MTTVDPGSAQQAGAHVGSSSTADDDAFAQRIRELRVPEPRADREALLLKAGGVLVGLGILGVIAAWVGASGTLNVGEQVPFAISGGLGGLALVLLGTALIIRFSLARLFRYWLARLVYEHQTQTDRSVAVLERIEAQLAEQRHLADTNPPAPPVTGSRHTGSVGGRPVDST